MTGRAADQFSLSNIRIYTKTGNITKECIQQNALMFNLILQTHVVECLVPLKGKQIILENTSEYIWVNITDIIPHLSHPARN